jgi:hypothetical protein
VNTTQLAKNYALLTPAERASLTLAAVDREDWEEHRRLSQAASRISCQVPDTYPRHDALIMIAGLHQIELLQAAVRFWAAVFAWMKDGEATPGGQQEAGPRYEAVRVHASWFVTLLDGWRQWGRELSTDVEALLKMLPAYDTVLEIEGTAREEAFTPDEARTRTLAGRPLPTPSDVVADLQKCLDAQLAVWR